MNRLQLKQLHREARRTSADHLEVILDLLWDLHERLDMTDETVADLKTKYEAFRDVVNAKIQALMDAQTGVTLPPTVQQAINDLAAEMTSDTANEAAGANAAVTPEVPAASGE